MTYWMMFNLVGQFEESFPWLLSFVPFKQLIKLFIFIWLQNPMTDGALIAYKKLIRPFANMYGDAIQEFYDEYVKPFEKGQAEDPNKNLEKEVKKQNMTGTPAKEPIKVEDIKLETASEGKKRLVN